MEEEEEDSVVLRGGAVACLEAVPLPLGGIVGGADWETLKIGVFLYV